MPHKCYSIKINSTAAQADKQLGIVTIDADVNWDNFLDFSTWLISILDAQFVNHELGADLHRVYFDFEDTRLFITLEETGGSLWLELDQKKDGEILEFIITLLKSHE